MTESFAELFEQSQTQLAKLKNGAIITGNSDGDMQALEIIMDKGCEAVIDTDIFNRPHYVPKVECFLMRTVYLAKYSKEINKK